VGHLLGTGFVFLCWELYWLWRVDIELSMLAVLRVGGLSSMLDNLYGSILGQGARRRQSDMDGDGRTRESMIVRLHIQSESDGP